MKTSIEINPTCERGAFTFFESFSRVCRSTTTVSGCSRLQLEAWVALACLSIFIGIATGQENDAVAPLSPAPQVDNVQKTEPQKPAAPVAADKIKKASAGMAAIVGIAILGIGAIAFTMIWARRVRRIARDPGPTQTTLGNDFWFLKPPKQISSVSKIDISPPLSPPETPE